MKRVNRLLTSLLSFCLIGVVSFLLFSQTKQLVESEVSTGFSYAPLSDEDGVIVLCYHRVLADNFVVEAVSKMSKNTQLHQFNVPLSDFTQQMQDLKERKVPVLTMDQLLEKRAKKELTGRNVVITFDDIDVTLSNNAFPVLEKEKFPFTAFVITGETGNNLSGSQMASWSQIKKLAASPLATFGVHTNDLHYQEKGKPVLSTNLPKKTMIDDYKKSQEIFKQELGYQADYFAYPYGAKNKRLTDYMSQNQIKGIFSLETGVVTNETLTTDMPRLIVTKENWPTLLHWLDNDTN